MSAVDPSAQLTAREAAALDELDEQRTRAEAAEAEADRLRKANKTIIGENHNVRAQLDRARDAVRNGDWDALWAALGIPATERLPEMHTALDTAVPVPAGWFDTAVEMGGLTAEQEIRARAVMAAIDTIGLHEINVEELPIDGLAGLMDRTTAEVLRTAGRFEAYIRDGDA